MKTNIKITANLTQTDVEDILKEHFSREGYEVTTFDFKLREAGDERFQSTYKVFSGVDCVLDKKTTFGNGPLIRDFHERDRENRR